jgi:hypothetical protein
MISRSGAGMAAIRAASTTRSTSCGPISRSLRDTATTPRLFWEAMCSPETDKYTERMVCPDIRSARSTASPKALVVASRSVTTPRRTPVHGTVPTPATCTSPSSSTSPTKAHTFVVPMSSPTRAPFLGTCDLLRPGATSYKETAVCFCNSSAGPGGLLPERATVPDVPQGAGCTTARPRKRTSTTATRTPLRRRARATSWAVRSPCASWPSTTRATRPWRVPTV